MLTKTLQDLLWNSYGIQTALVEHREPLINNVSKKQYIPYNPNRVALVIVNNGGNALYMTTELQTALDDGIALSAYGGSVSFQWDRDFILGCSQWCFNTVVGTSKLYWLEVITRSDNTRTE